MSDFAPTLSHRFESFHTRGDGLRLSIKLRSVGGCFDCSNCNPVLRAHLDRILQPSADDGIDVERHESGPEWLVYATAGLSFLASLATLVATVLQARRDGNERGDRVRCDVELIVRGLKKDGTVFEEKVLRIGSDNSVDEKAIKSALAQAVRGMLPSSAPAVGKAAQTGTGEKPPLRSKRTRK